MLRPVPPAIVLFILSPVIGELLSGSSPPTEFFNPLTFFLLAVLYGGGAIWVRELVVGWGKGWLSLFVLGAAYGIIEEGLMCKSFFDPNWVDLGWLGVYGRWSGVNWVWAQGLTAYHATFSIAIPILLVELTYPQERNRSWVSPSWLRVIGLLFTLDVLFGFCCFPKPESPYYPPPFHVIGTIVIVIALVWLARQLPTSLPVPLSVRVPSTKKFAFLGFVTTFAFFATFWGLPNTNLHPLVTMVFGTLVIWPGVHYALKWSGNGHKWGDTYRWALASGALGFFILLAPLQELSNPTRPDNTAGMSLVGLIAIAGLWWLRKRLICGRNSSQ
ncbi:MAG: hypothetical protein ACUVSC_09040 [Candidatus Fervidibacter sp.]|uniref:hypothetical protein n=1 Tax=Candidatus Fervidibacter sp. TaxID=3100871 RepID=UPI00404A3BF5